MFFSHLLLQDPSIKTMVPVFFAGSSELAILNAQVLTSWMASPGHLYFLINLKRLNMPTQTLNVYRCTVESILTDCIIGGTNPMHRNTRICREYWTRPTCIALPTTKSKNGVCFFFKQVTAACLLQKDFKQLNPYF